MSLALLKVELKNFRSHEHLVYEPGRHGVSVIRGANGTGKSSIVDGLAWALYGTKPSKVPKNSALLRHGTDLKEEGQRSYVTVDVEIDGQHLRMQRRIMTNGGKTEGDVWKIHADGTEEHLAGSSVTDAQNYMIKQLRMDEQGFLAAVMVQQKEVDSLILAGGARRAAIIEKLTGITAITKSLELAAKEHNQLKDHAKRSSVDEDAIEDNKKQLEQVTKDQEKVTQRVATLEEQFKQKRAAARDFQATLVEQENAAQEAQAAQDEMLTLTTRIESAEDELASLNESRAAKRDQLRGLDKSLSVVEVEQQHKELTTRLRTTQSNLTTAERGVETATAQMESYRELIGDRKPKEVSDELVEGSTTIRTLEQREEELKVAMNSRSQDIQKIEKAIRVLEEGHGSCPTCLQEVSDISHVVQTLEADIQKQRDANTADETTLEATQDERIALQQTVDTLSSVAEAFSKLQQTEADLKQHKADALSYGSDVKVLEKEVEQSEKTVYKARRFSETKEEYDRLLERAKKISDMIEQSKKRYAELQQTVKDLKVLSAEKLSKRRAKLDKEKEELADMKNEIIESRGQRDVLAERAKHLEQDIARLENDLQKHKELLESVELAASTRHLIEEFRTARIESAIPVIEVHASDLLTAFTDGKFIGIELDAKFNASVILADETVRPVELLSGGELSAAAIALRIAISMMLTGGSGAQLMILDEVLVSQDLDRAEKILSTIKNIAQGQIILIAHSEIVESIADHSFDVTQQITAA